MFRKLLFLLSVAVLPMVVNAKVVLPQLFQSGMVLQRGKPIPVWGKADPHEHVNIKWQKRQYAVLADADGRWRVDLPQMKAGGPYILEVSGEGSEVLTIQDVLVGDVWLCSGQSNVDVTIERVYPQYPAEIDRFDNNRVRLFRVPNVADTHGVRDDIAPTQWKPLNKENAWGFSALGTFLG
ncbi:MAG: sialate O-acetylesterase, partial [Prevotella sp.]|nr:sialate O-acetylesterase [Prevotella sp.]